jgi:uncharacterized membrane protein
LSSQVPRALDVAAALYRLALGAYIALIALVLAWEGWLAPAPGVPAGFWLAVKSLPLLIPLFGLVRARPRAFLWAELLVLPYFIEGIVIAWSMRSEALRFDEPPAYAWAEIALTSAYIVLSALYIRHRGGRAAVVR